MHGIGRMIQVGRTINPERDEVYPIGTMDQIMAINRATTGIENAALRSPSTGVQEVVRSFGQRFRADALSSIRDGVLPNLRIHVPSLVPGSIIESALVGEVHLHGQAERTISINGTGLYLKVAETPTGRHRIIAGTQGQPHPLELIS